MARRRSVRRLIMAEGLERDRRLVEIEGLAADRGIAIERVSRAELDRRMSSPHQGLLLEVSEYPYGSRPEPGALAAQGASILALDGVVDPRNVGALLRSAEATGFGYVVIPNDRAAGITPTVVHASAGAAEHLVVWREVNLGRWLSAARQAGIWTAGLAMGNGSVPLFDVDLRPPIALVIGSEQSGLRRLVRDACDVIVEIPMAGRIGSLNASVAGALAMYEVRRWIDGGDEDRRSE